MQKTIYNKRKKIVNDNDNVPSREKMLQNQSVKKKNEYSKEKDKHLVTNIGYAG